MIYIIQKYIFGGSEKNATAPHIFTVLLFYFIASSIYFYTILYGADFFIRISFTIAIAVVFVLLERSPLKANTLSYLSPSVLVILIVAPALYFSGDFLLFHYVVGGAMISLTYMKPRGVAIFVIITSVINGFILIFLGENILGPSFTMAQNYVGYLVSVGLSLIVYVFCKSYTTASGAKEIFLSNMSHELRTPLNAIIGMTIIGKSSDQLDKAVESLSKIEDASTHLLGIINDVLDMSKIQSGKFEISNEQFNFDKMLIRVHNVVSFHFADKKQKFTATIDEKIPPCLIGDDLRLAQILANLLGNAAKFTHEGGHISLNISLVREVNNICTIKVEVKDSGIGISRDKQKNLFHAFQQAETNITRKYGGTGLGLSIAKNIVEMMNGRIWVDSVLGEGSVFGFTFQMLRGTTESSVETAFPDDDSLCYDSVSFSNKCILLAEDVEINREIVCALLEPMQLTIVCAENGTEAVRLFSESPNRFDFIFMDVQMPEMDGYEATRRIRAMDVPQAACVPIVAMSANVFRQDIEKCLESGMNDHVGKPIDLDNVIAVMKKYLK